MTRLAVWATLLALLPAARGASPDPKSLAIPVRELSRAQDLAGRLGDNVFQVREQATRELCKMGRLALPAVEQALAKATDPEVRARCEWLLPKALADDSKARLDTFLADADGKRSSGAWARAVWTTALSAGGIDGRTAEGSGTGPLSRASATAAAVSPSQGRVPTSIS